jgi:hypothetical protein
VPDHCREWEHVRGFICNPCSLSLGLMKDNPEFLRAAADYLEADIAARLLTPA